MYRDPSEFRERFKAYKEGKSVREIYGLPGYAEGAVGADPELDMIKKYEGWRDKTYLDSKGIPTIGWGFTDSSLVSKGTMSRKEGDVYLSKRVLKRKVYLRNKLGPLIWDKLDTATKAALLSYDHNYPAGFGDDTRFMRYWRAGRYNEAVSEMDAGMNDESSPGLRPRRLDEQAAVRKDSFLFPKVKSQKPIDVLVQRPDATIVATTIPQEKTIPIIDPRNATIAEALRAMWAHTAFENMPKVSDMPMWKSPSLPTLTPVEYDVTPLKTYAGGKVAEQNEPVITQGRAGSRLEKFRRSMDSDENDGTATRVLKGVGRGAADLALDLTRASGIEALDRFATETLRPQDYVDVAFLTVGNAMISKIMQSLAKAFIKHYVKGFDLMDARALGEYFFREHPELMTKPQEAWYEELAKKLNSYFLQAIYRRSKAFLKEGVTVNPESISSLLRPEIKIAHLGEKNKYGGIYSASDNTMLVNADRVKDPRTAMRVTGHEDAHAMQSLFEDVTGRPYPTRYGAEMEGLFPFTAKQKAKRTGVHIGKEIDASLHEGKMMRYYDTNNLGKVLDRDFKNMSDEEYKEYMNNGYFKDIMENILSDLNAQKKFMSKLKNGKLPGYTLGKNPTNATMYEDGTFIDDYTKVFDDIYITPKKVDLKYGSHTLNNFPEYLANRTAWMLTFMPQSVLNDKPLEQPAIDPFLLLITGGRFSGDLTGDVIEMGLDKALKIAINSAANAARVAAKTPVGKRTVETIMRTSSNPTPFDKIKNGVKTFDKNRSKAVLNYILTGKRTGDFGYYNSFAETPELAYTGFVSERLKKYALDLDEANIMLHNPSSEYGDAIDAYLYNKQIDPVYGFDLVSIGNDFGPHGQYILLNYNKVSKNIPVYESPVLTIEIRVPRSQTSQVKSIENIGDEGYIRGAYSNRGNVEYDAAGHLKQLGTFANVPMARELDIWKYLPSDYNKYTTDLKGIRKVLQYIGTNAVDAAGTPIIVRTPWQYYPNYSGEFINKIAGYSNGKIRIKPANRGKFNATKKRTGKTTEELTHSKNPLTRKRAIFALNAKKWNHK